MGQGLAGWLNGLAGVLIFSASLPATRAAVGGFDPIFLTAARAVVAALLGLALLIALRQPRPARADIGPLLIVALGVVAGFPLLTAMALQTVTAAHSIVFIGVLPLLTAIFGVLRDAERPAAPFWIFSGLGGALVAGFALTQGGGGGSIKGDALMIGAIILCGLGYAEGAALSRRLGGWQVISWALLIFLPVMGGVALLTAPQDVPDASPAAWLGFAYVSVFSMLIGFVFWYRGLAMGGIAGVGQLQLLQPFFGLMLANWLLGEAIAPAMVLATVLVVGCVVAAKRFAAG